jgi:hypothetical protein
MRHLQATPDEGRRATGLSGAGEDRPRGMKKGRVGVSLNRYLWQDRQAMTRKTGFGGGSTVTFVRAFDFDFGSPDSAYFRDDYPWNNQKEIHYTFVFGQPVARCEDESFFCGQTLLHAQSLIERLERCERVGSPGVFDL